MSVISTRVTAGPTEPTPPPVLAPPDRLIARRFSFGLTPDLAREITAAGSGRSWFLSQLQADSLADPGGDEVDSWFPYLDRTMAEIARRSRERTEKVGPVMVELSRRTVSRRLRSTRQLHEVMVDFWSNLLHVPLFNLDAAPARADYDRVVRDHALGTFEQLLQQTIVHPAMGINLNNNVSTKVAPNENLGRELLELHTVGVDAGYTEADVKASAKILTGYRVDLDRTFDVYYDPASHWTGALQVMGFRTDNRDPDGRTVVSSYLSYLANHPATARRIARRLCVRFVSDNPSDALVDAVAAAYSANATAIRPTLTALVDHAEFKASAGRKVRSPQEDWQAMVRALGITVRRPVRPRSFVTSMYSQYHALGAAPYEWGPPNGYPEVGGAWSGAGRMLQSFDVHKKMCFHSPPWSEADIPDLAALVPAPPISLQKLLDAYAVLLVGEPASTSVGRAVSTLLGWPLDRTVSAQEARRSAVRIGIVATVLDSPQHLYR